MEKQSHGQMACKHCTALEAKQWEAELSVGGWNNFFENVYL